MTALLSGLGPEGRALTKDRLKAEGRDTEEERSDGGYRKRKEKRFQRLTITHKGRKRCVCVCVHVCMQA
jgi:hypothetical protein